MSTQSIISKKFNGIIWRIEIDEITNTLFIEIRNNEDRNVFFAAINLKTADVYFEEFTTPEKWLTGIEAAFNNVLLLHYYQSETGPVHKGLLAIDALTSEILWSNYNFAFDHLSVNGPIIYDTRVQPRKLFLADIHTGVTRGIFDASVNKELINNIILPQLIGFDELLLKLIPAQPVGNMVHYLEYNNFRIVSLHALKDDRLTQSLFIVDGVGNVVYDDLLNHDIQKIQPEAFMMYNNYLLYIKNKSELKVISL
ncbi:DUF4905 domain-containing protein [Mucilaginibacter sp. X4EP1]|uniref:DUF4905 domain-containing protein n=1 Tax=Mucilaginibacter sp. X4EP1 TaxID=2723092 RepID=UPI0021683523|nr:DUF4905 domain-containing protein [Mucilaginibacter sp. X4EP1]MCS3814980.1 hypothetical protein [Mucilaginibacter sp. X4EP1]